MSNQHLEMPGVTGAALDSLADGFIEEVVAAGKESAQAASFMVFDRLDQMLWDGSYAACDAILRRAEARAGELTTYVMRSLLVITCVAKAELTARQSLFGRIEKEMRNRRGVEVTQRLLGRLA